jgi:hypothetical protein
LPRSMARFQDVSTRPRTPRWASGSASKTQVSWPEIAQSPAMPRPIVPAPTTRTEVTEGLYGLGEGYRSFAALSQRIRFRAASDSGSARKSSMFLLIEVTPGLG